MSEEVKRQIEKIIFTFPVALDWIIEEEKIPFNDEDEYMMTKIYNVPGFPLFSYNISFDPKIENKTFSLSFNRNGLNDDKSEWESNLCLTINNGEAKKVFQNFKEHELLLYEGSNEELKKSKKSVFDPITLGINGTITVYEISMPDYDYAARIPLSYEFKKIKEPKDFVIDVENQEIQVHKKLLQFYSPVFSAMFENGWKEAIESRVVIPEFPFKTVKTAIGLC